MTLSSHQKVVLEGLPPGFIDDLSKEDQQALLGAVGKQVVLNGYDVDGRAELEFCDKRGVQHVIYVDSKFINFGHPKNA